MMDRGDIPILIEYRDQLFTLIEVERHEQDRKWGPGHDRQHAPLDWARIICDLAINAAEEDQSGPWDETQAQREIIKIAATAIAWIEARASKENPDA